MFDTNEDRVASWPYDIFVAIRMLFEAFNRNCPKHVIPSEYLSIDETLYPMRNQISFKQYNPNKPAKYGLLFKSLNDSTHIHITAWSMLVNPSKEMGRTISIISKTI